jgi:hypothetical protein
MRATAGARKDGSPAKCENRLCTAAVKARALQRGARLALTSWVELYSDNRPARMVLCSMSTRTLIIVAGSIQRICDRYDPSTPDLATPLPSTL